MASIDKIMLHIWVEEPFYAGMTRNVRFRADSDCPTAGVRYLKGVGKFELVYNPKFIAGMTFMQGVAIFKHELMHLIFEHVSGRRHPMERHGVQIWNHATDLAINSFLRGELPRKLVDADTGEVKDLQFIVPGESMYEDYPPFQAAEWYLSKILNDPNIEKIAQASMNMVGDHSEWGEGPGKDGGAGKDPLEDAELKRVIRDAQKEAMERSWGSVPAEIQKMVGDHLHTTVNWKQVLRYFINGTRKAEKFSTFKKYNKRYPYQQPGRRQKRAANIAVSIDQSGSVSDQLLAKFFAELKNLASEVSFTVVPFDTRVVEDNVYEWRKNKSLPPERVACGGTDFNAPTKWVNEKTEFDAHIVLTDMGAPKPIVSRCPRLWITERAYEQSIPEVAGNEMSIVIT